MSLVAQLVGFGLRQVIGDYAGDALQVVAAVEQRFRDHSRTLPKALDQAHNRAWQALGVALAGDGLLDRVKVFFASGDDKGVREQVHCFLTSNAVSFDGAPADFRRDCLDELKRLRKSGLLSTTGGSSADIARQAAGFRRHADPQGLIEEARRAVAGVADALGEGYPNLARLLRVPTPAGPPLLAAAFCYFFRREIETDDELAHGLFFDGLRQLSATQARAFGEVGKALAAFGGQFDAVFEQLDRVEAAVVETHAVAVETHGAVLDVQTELQRLGGLHLTNASEVRTLLEQVLLHLAQAGMARGEVRPGNSCSIRGEDERRAVKALLARFRLLPAEEQRQAPALLNGLGKLQVGAGDFAEARQTFTEVVQAVGNPSDKAEASFNAYRAALEDKKWDAALAALREAGSHDPQRFAPFPLHRYEPQRILGAGGFGTAILCLDRHFDEDVVVKTLHAADLARGVDEVFGEARILRRLSHPAIIGVRDCEYADPAHKARPYLVMDHFPGSTLQQFVDERGPLGLENLLPIAVQTADGVRAAHAQGVLHRDLKPANLLVHKDGDRWQVKIIDFGLALRQQTIDTSKVRIGAAQKSMLDWSVVGTLDYAPPEQLGKMPAVLPGPYSDVFAFGKMCLYSLFKITESSDRLWKETPAPGRAKLRKLLEQCIERDLSHRHPSFEPVVAALEGMKRSLRGCDQWAAWEAEQRQRQEDKKRRALEAADQARQKEEQQRQQEGEEQLRQLVRAAMNRTGGKPTPDDTAKAKDICRRCKLATDRAMAVIREAKDGWRYEREEQERKRKQREAALRAEEEARRREQEETERRLCEEELQRLAEQQSLREQETKARHREDEARRLGEQQLRADLKECESRISAEKNSSAYLNMVHRERLGLWKAHAEQGVPQAQWLYADCLLEGVGVKKDLALAVAWFRKAAEQGLALAQMSLGNRYNNGEGIPKKWDEAARWYRKAAEQGNAAAQYNLGVMYEQGRGVANDEAEAVKWYRKAAEQGNARAQLFLGAMYKTGRGVAKDDAEAVRWYRKAAEQGSADAQNNLGLMFDTGRGVAHDPVEAVKWFCLAADQGNERAKENLGRRKGDAALAYMPLDKVKEPVTWHEIELTHPVLACPALAYTPLDEVKEQLESLSYRCWRNDRDREGAVDEVMDRLQSLSYTMRTLLEMRYGLFDGHAYTREQVARIFLGTLGTPEEIDAIEAKAIASLRQSPEERDSKIRAFIAGIRLD